MRKTKIIATIGPKTKDVESIKKLINCGADAIRLNFSHDTREMHAETAKRVMQAREELGTPTALVLDTKGPEIRTGVLKDGLDIELVMGQTLILTTDEIEGNKKRLSVTYKNLPYDVKRGSKILIDDGLIELKVKDTTQKEVICEVINGGTLGSRKGINIPDVFVNLPALTEKDILDIKLGAEVGFDFIAASFIRSASDVVKIRDLLDTNGGSDIQIIAKIENRDGVKNIDEILQVADAIMVARGDLGVEIPAEDVPVVQKMLIDKANTIGKPVVTATQMLESMVKNPRPTRAEASDVANAVFDGTSIIMLSGETAKGDYPFEAVETMARISKSAEQMDRIYNTEVSIVGKMSMTNAVSQATCTAADDLGASAIIVVTKSGHSAKSISKYKPKAPIIACTIEPKTQRQLNLVWGCLPHLISFDKDDTDDVFAKAVAKAEAIGVAKQGDAVVITAGVPIGVPGTTNILKIQCIGDVLARGFGSGGKIISAKASVIKIEDEAEKFFKRGDILVTRKTDNNYLKYMKKASAIVVEDATPEENNHAVIVGKTLDIPVIFDAPNASEAIKSGTTVTVNSIKGLVYNGVIKG
ncbi:pyruvate kinase [Candidatus Epulonipiscium fishelsonii]|uniref:Pyruvate kinase n=1 Tax=Candidatus Epulonipiscium fishelsonii TaxID=77094 RepID=A0ACC8XE35_9FIRM|nr:pyruvate kinase [Epulopiscium sp. SCG-D08WGA-EpuloA1]OON96432.1 MAG: pyruvate kinase [Epulopiscium sp. AS2M-Bin002]